MTPPTFTPAAIQQERERVLGLLSGVTPGEWQYRPWKHEDWGMVRGEDGHIVALGRNSRIGDEEKTAHREAGTDPYEANARLICAAPALARDYAATLGEIERLREALKACAGILAGGDMTKNGLIDALEQARAALASAPEERL